jgi:hypothetical protein
VRLCLCLLLVMLPLRGFAAAQMAVAAPLPGSAHAACHERAGASEHRTHQGGTADLPGLAEGAQPAHHAHPGEQADMAHVAHLAPDTGLADVSEPGPASGCACCLFCAPALPGAFAALPGQPPAGGLVPAAGRGAAPEGVRDPLLRPPRA